jgi:hypothetical protein
MFFGPFVCQESHNLIRAFHELISIPPNRVGGVSAFDNLRIPTQRSAEVLIARGKMSNILCIPSILRSLDLDPRCLERKRGEWGLRGGITCHFAINLLCRLTRIRYL